jgi:hypothetical protein
LLHIIFACKIFLDNPQNICFFVGNVAIHLWLGLAIKNIQKLKKLGFNKTLDWFFWRWSNLRDAKKIKRKTENIHERKLDRILITCSPATAPEKGACWRYIFVLKFK